MRTSLSLSLRRAAERFGVPLAGGAVIAATTGGMLVAGYRPTRDACRAAPGEPSPDLYCIPLVPAPAFREATGSVRMRRVASPFGAAVTREGEPLYDLSIVAAGLPAPESVGPFSTYVAWVTTPVLSPVVKVGAIRDGRAPEVRISFPKFLVLISAEAADTVSERRGRLVLRGTSPSMRALPHEVARLMGSLTGITEAKEVRPQAARPEDAHREDAQREGRGSAAWALPPRHPGVQMIPAMTVLRPEVAPYLPLAPRGVPVAHAKPREVAELRDGETLRLEAGIVRRTIGGRTFTMYGFNGQYPGPLIRVSQGATIVVDFTNRLDLPTSVHWHGVRLENRYDGAVGVTQEAVPPGGRFEYRVTFPDAGIYWYHPHHREDVQQELGLYGNMLVRSPLPDYYGPANREEVLMLDDLLVGDSGLVPFGREAATHALMGRFGNVLLVNGEAAYRLEARRGEVVRFFLTNVSNTRTFNLSLDGAPMKVVGSDVGNFEREEWAETIVIAPAERFVVDALFDRPGEVALTNRVLGFDHAFGAYFHEVDTLGVARVSEEAVAEDFSGTFRRLRVNRGVTEEIDPYRALFERPVDRELVLTVETNNLPFAVEWMLKMDSAFFNPVEWSGTMPLMNWATTGREVRWILRDPATGRENREIDDWRFRVGDVVKLRLTNERSALHAMQHPIHIHGQRFLILSQGGVPNRNLAWKDTILLPVGSTAEILLELSNPGDWMLHCHIAEHLEAGMMMVFTVDPADGSRPEGEN